MTWAQGQMIELIAAHPFTVTIPSYTQKVKDGLLPTLRDMPELRPHQGGASWVKRRKVDRFAIDRVFGFNTHDRLLAFKRKYKLGDGE